MDITTVKESDESLFEEMMNSSGKKSGAVPVIKRASKQFK